LLAPHEAEPPIRDGQQAGRAESGSKLPHSKAGLEPGYSAREAGAVM